MKRFKSIRELLERYYDDDLRTYEEKIEEVFHTGKPKPEYSDKFGRNAEDLRVFFDMSRITSDASFNRSHTPGSRGVTSFSVAKVTVTNGLNISELIRDRRAIMIARDVIVERLERRDAFRERLDGLKRCKFASFPVHGGTATRSRPRPPPNPNPVHRYPRMSPEAARREWLADLPSNTGTMIYTEYVRKGYILNPPPGKKPISVRRKIWWRREPIGRSGNLRRDAGGQVPASAIQSRR